MITSRCNPFMRPPARAAVIAAIFCGVHHLSLPAAADPGSDFFESKVRPILVERCQKCHGSEKQWSGLRLDSRTAALTGGDSGPALIAGKPEESELFLRISESDGDFRMPPPKEGPPLTAEQIEAIKQWIHRGAPWPASTTPDIDAKERLRHEHWAFQPIQRAEPPSIEEASRIATPIDAFVIAKLRAAGLELAPEADRRTLIRRATYDLTGLPPTPAEVESFASDPSPDAYERLIDRLLSSPRYGEHWGRYWLDIARYADTKGYVYTRENRYFFNSAPYRDWVINSFNDDLPYNRFVVLQLAADLAAPDDPESLAAMGFLTLGRRMLGITPDIIEDRIDVVSRGLLGLTVGCARCHDHKFDPIPTADYYSLYGVFQNCVERQAPLPAAANADNEKQREVEAELRDREKKLAETLALRRNEESQVVRSRVREYLEAQLHIEDFPDLGVVDSAEPELLLSGFARRWEAYLKQAAARRDPVFVAWIAYVNLPVEDFANRAEEVSKRLLAEPDAMNPRVRQAFATPPASAAEVVERYAKLFADVDAAWAKALSDAQSADKPQPNALPDPADEALRQVLYGKDSPCIIPDEPIVNTEYLWHLKYLEEVWKLQARVEDWLFKHPDELRYTVVLTDREKIVEPQVFRRGNPMNKGETVPRQMIGVAAGGQQRPFKLGSGRLELANAIVDPANPLTTRVWVNRVWQQHFGAGLVTTPSDFGARSSPPSHPELLNWLAHEFMQQGWRTKWLHRTIMLSAAYRQSSQPVADATARAKVQKLDPENRLLWRMSPRRLSFEQFRDTLLATSQELDTTMGGKGTDLFSSRRSVYMFVDRQYLPNVFSVFDFANPDFHASQRAETTNPQQALFAINHPFVADRARKIAAVTLKGTRDPIAQVVQVYNIILQRDPSATELRTSVQFLNDATAQANEHKVADDSKSWSYGYGEVDPMSGLVKSFQPLTYFTGSAWQGGPLWPDAALGWVRHTAKGGHVGNDHKHAAIRRWTAKSAGVVSIKSEIAHQEKVGDGIRCWIVSSRDGVVATAAAFNARKPLDVDTVDVEPGDTIDFVADMGKSISYDDYLWTATISEATTLATGGVSTNQGGTTWNAEKGFPLIELGPVEQLVQLLLVSNEVMFLD